MSFRGDEHTTPTENLTIEINLEPTTEETGSCTTVQDTEETLETVQIKAEVSEVQDKSVTDPSPRYILYCLYRSILVHLILFYIQAIGLYSAK